MKHYQIVLDVLEYIHKNNYYPYDKVEIAISALSLNEKRLTTYILMETLRKTVLIDYVLSEFLSNPGKLPGKILNILRIGTMQILFSENYTNRKIVNDMV
ncbi:MAG: rRNA (cytosine967-C5)-methyltransferase, partial [Kosmotogales bacterium]|nr:rRNA (cytosine967-C5)-methyltransferase [Kosmotogales bacterium]